jgi:tetratricopeptide (TPR) repeat protein
MRPPDDAGLGPQGEAEWQRLRRQVELAEGFWLCFIFAPSPRSTGVLRRRTERLLRAQTRLLSLYAPSHPDELPTVLSSLISPEARDAGCHWIEALLLDSGEQPEGPWHKAWVELAVLMNERRDALRRNLQGGLVLVAPARMKQHFRDMASDLWSVRALVLELVPVAEPTGGRGSLDLEHSSPRASSMERSDSIPDADFALAELQRLQARYTGSASALASVLIHAVDGLLASKREGEALEAANQTWELIHARSQEDPQSSALILHALAKSEEANGDLAAASDHLEHATSLTSGWTNRQRLFLLEDMMRLAQVRKDWHEASRASEEALALTRQLRQLLGDTPETLRDLSVSLERVGDVQRARGELQAASASFEESLALARQLRQLLGDTPESLRDISVSLNFVGDVQRARGELQAASASYEESLALARQLLSDTPESLRDIYFSLIRVGDVQRARGELQAASASFEEALALARQLRQLLGDTPESLRDISVSLNVMGDVQQARGELQAASASFEESLALARQLRQLLGNSPEALRHLSISLNFVGDVQQARGELQAASASFEESLALRRQLRQLLGDTPEALRDLSASLIRVGDVQHARDELQAASASFEESLSLVRRTRERLGDTPQGHKDLSYALMKAATIREALGDEKGAQAARDEADALGSPED